VRDKTKTQTEQGYGKDKDTDGNRILTTDGRKTERGKRNDTEDTGKIWTRQRTQTGLDQHFLYMRLRFSNCLAALLKRKNK
jgi:hypothetical protein